MTADLQSVVTPVPRDRWQRPLVVPEGDDSTRVLAQGCRILPPGKPAALWLDVREERTGS
ncbi:MAG TPA: hypothetical protein VFJ13_03630 [Paracoccaceae bacterium]|nr:hypothetical protein [Paracoccaceae bacterium]